MTCPQKAVRFIITQQKLFDINSAHIKIEQTYFAQICTATERKTKFSF